MKAVLILGIFIFADNLWALDTGAKVKVNGMVCSFCTSSIEKKFKENKEVAEVSVDLDTKTVFLKYVQDKELKEEQIKDIITKSGYTVVSIEHQAGGDAPSSVEKAPSDAKSIPQPNKKK
ncbi:MAG: heavy-metal-associated domain-containing protein [Bdellovibrionaceae bacterium]|nr:heavy-metal-associated domain-containing protein [Pseudobdellovibrionaceae bacterium]